MFGPKGYVVLVTRITTKIIQKEEDSKEVAFGR